jgi:hypothetical protein
MPKKPKVSLHPIVDGIDKMLKDLNDLDEPTNEKDKQRVQKVKDALADASQMLRSECSNSGTVYEFPN